MSACTKTLIALDLADQPSSWRLFGPDMRNGSETSEESQINKAMSLLDGCATKNKLCAYNQAKLPTRLLNIALMLGDEKICLVDAKDLLHQSKQRYVALSHCWGSGQPLRMSKCNVDSMKEDAPLSKCAALALGITSNHRDRGSKDGSQFV